MSMSFLDDNYFLTQALKQAYIAYEEDEVPVGCVIVYKNRIIAKAHNRVEALKDVTAHAEILAIGEASNFLNSKFLYECTAYVTLEPCSMCAGAFVLSRIKRIVFGCKDSKAGACVSLFNITNNYLLNHRIEVEEIKDKFLNNQCSSIIKRFFEDKRRTTSKV